MNSDHGSNICSLTHLKRNIDLLCRHIGASQMHAGLDTDEALACFDHFRGQIRRTPSGVPVDIMSC